jgi:hypothetical protein
MEASYFEVDEGIAAIIASNGVSSIMDSQPLPEIDSSYCLQLLMRFAIVCCRSFRRSHHDAIAVQAAIVLLSPKD